MKVVSKNGVSAELAGALIDAVVAEAVTTGVPSSIAVADESGVLKALLRMDGASVSSLQVAQDKAYSSAVTGTPTGAWREIVSQDPALAFGLDAINRICPLGGGIPVVVDGEVVGGLGISGGTVAQDEHLAGAAKAALGI